MYKIGFLIVNNNTTGYYKDLFDKLSKEPNVEVNWVNIKFDNIIYSRKTSFIKKGISFINSKILYLISSIEKKEVLLNLIIIFLKMFEYLNVILQ